VAIACVCAVGVGRGGGEEEGVRTLLVAAQGRQQFEKAAESQPS